MRKIIANLFNFSDPLGIIKPNSGDDQGDLPLTEHIIKRLTARKIEFISTAIICTIFAISFAHLEYYYIKDPALKLSNGEVVATENNIDRSRETKPIVGNMYQYHLFPMLFIFFLMSFAALWDDMSFKLLGRHNRIKALFLGVANLTTAILVEDFAWFVNRYLFPLEGDPKGHMLMQSSDWTSIHIGALDLGNFVIPNWYLIALVMATLTYYAAFRRHDKLN
jgi:hypothetical protein